MVQLQSNTVEENIIFSTVPSNVQWKLVANNINTLYELASYDIFELLSLPTISVFDIVSIKETLNSYDYHFDRENYVDRSDFLDNQRTELLKKCDKLAKLRGEYKIELEKVFFALPKERYKIVKKQYKRRDKVIRQQMLDIFIEIRELREISMSQESKMVRTLDNN